MPERTRLLMRKVAQIVAKLPNKISISGHTDAKPYRGARAGHGNWELSSDRALASRRELVGGGLKTNRILKVEGKAETDPLIKKDPLSARNRRISIVLLREANDAAKAGAGNQTAEVPKTETKQPPPREFRPDWTGPRLR
jgi:chemotaxis protein MotB